MIRGFATRVWNIIIVSGLGRKDERDLLTEENINAGREYKIHDCTQKGIQKN